MMKKEVEELTHLLDSNRDISQWVIRGDYVREHQFFAHGSSAEEYRTVVSQPLSVEIMHIQGKHMGSSSFMLSPHEFPLAEERMDKAVDFCRKLVNNRLHFLPPPQSYRRRPLTDPAMKADPRRSIKELWQRMTGFFARHKAHKLATAEIFVTLGEHFFRSSLGCQGSYDFTKGFVDFVITSSFSDQEAESHGECTFMTGEGLALEEILGRHSSYAADKLNTSLPPTGTCPVVISREALLPLFEAFIFHSSAKTIDMGISAFSRGKSVCGGKDVEGDPLTLVSDPTIPYGIRTFPFDRDGVPGKRLVIIDRSIFKNIWATREYADYLKVPATGEFGNLVVTPGTTDEAALLSGGEGGPVLHVVEFSFLHPDAATGSFVDEIRLGYLIEHGTARPVRGGSVSGNVFECFRKARFSRECFTSGRYIGPRSIRFEDLTISGSS
jgi:predicted Zn-dependent protease